MHVEHKKLLNSFNYEVTWFINPRGPNPLFGPRISSTIVIIATTFSSSHFLPTICTETGMRSISIGLYIGFAAVYNLCSIKTERLLESGDVHASVIWSLCASTCVTGRIPTGLSTKLYRAVLTTRELTVVEPLRNFIRLSQCADKDGHTHVGFAASPELGR